MHYKRCIVDMFFLAYKAFYYCITSNTDTYCVIDENIQMNTSIISGVLYYLRFLKQKFDTTMFLVYDRMPTKRKQIQETYKQQRTLFMYERKKTMNFYKQLDILTEMMKYSALTQLWKEGYEADDVIASFSQDGDVVVSNDKDLYQILDKVDIYNFKTIKTKAWFLNEYGIEPSQWCYVQMLAGDRTDNVQGIKNIGVKRAIKMVKEKQIDVCSETLSLVTLEQNLSNFTIITPCPSYSVLTNYFFAYNLPYDANDYL